MLPKISLLSALAVGAASLLTWGGFEAHKNQEYNKKMWEYERWREEFFKNTGTKTLMCENKSQEECTGGKGYLPRPNENKDWDQAYKSLEANRKSEYKLPEIKNFEDLKDYCFAIVKKNLENVDQFNPSSQDSCFLIISK